MLHAVLDAMLPAVDQEQLMSNATCSFNALVAFSACKGIYQDVTYVMIQHDGDSEAKLTSLARCFGSALFALTGSLQKLRT